MLGVIGLIIAISVFFLLNPPGGSEKAVATEAPTLSFAEMMPERVCPPSPDFQILTGEYIIMVKGKTLGYITNLNGEVQLIPKEGNPVVKPVWEGRETILLSILLEDNGYAYTMAKFRLCSGVLFFTTPKLQREPFPGQSG